MGFEADIMSPPDTVSPPPWELPDAEVVAGIRECEARLRRALARQVGLIAEAEHRGLHSHAGARSTRVWLRELLAIAEDDAKSRVVVARAVQDRTAPSGPALPPELPATADA